MDSGQPRYLRYEKAVAAVSGLNHQVTNLACLLRDAHASGRSAIVPPLFLDAKHNFNISRDWRRESFFDFRRSHLVDAHRGRLGRRRVSPDRPANMATCS